MRNKIGTRRTIALSISVVTLPLPLRRLLEHVERAHHAGLSGMKVAISEATLASFAVAGVVRQAGEAPRRLGAAVEVEAEARSRPRDVLDGSARTSSLSWIFAASFSQFAGLVLGGRLLHHAAERRPVGFGEDHVEGDRGGALSASLSTSLATMLRGHGHWPYSASDASSTAAVQGRDGAGECEGSYYTWVDQFDTFGLGKNTPINTGNASEGLLALKDGKWVILRVPYPTGFYTKWMDGRIDDAKAGWKGRGLWATVSTRAPFHMETGKGTTSKVLRLVRTRIPLAR